MGSPITARTSEPDAQMQVDPAAAQRSAMQYAETQRKLREARGRRSMFLTYSPTAADTPRPTLDKTVGRANGSTSILGG